MELDRTIREVEVQNQKKLFDDITIDSYGHCWTQICDACTKKLKLYGPFLCEGDGHGICGVIGCSEESEHYYDFDDQEEEAQD